MNAILLPPAHKPPPAASIHDTPPCPFEQPPWGLEQKALVTGVLKAIQPVDASQLWPIATADAGIAYRPKSLLALLTYCYAMGILGSQDIEHSLEGDPLFRLLCNNEFPNWHAIRRFRRINRHALHHTLHAACLNALQQPTPCGLQPCPLLANAIHPWPPGEPSRSQALSRQLAALIDHLLEKAVWLDSVNLD